jgi:glycosyltransferase involved in cell wall biosynthesis
MQPVSASTSERIQPGEISNRRLVSVIIPFLNAQQFIQEAIESVFAQTYTAWELLLVDDGSSDGSTAIARRYAGEYRERVRYLEHPGDQNRGKTASRNLGIRYATGEYVAFLDADDVWMPHKLEQQVTTLDTHPEAAMVYGLSQYWYSWTGKPEDQRCDFVDDLGVSPNTLIQPPALLTRFFLAQKAAIPNPSNILVRHEIIEQVNGFDEAFGDYYEDQAFLAKVCLKACVFATSECWDRYRQHPNSSSSIAQKTGLEYSTRLFFLNWLAGYLSDQGVKEPKIWQGLRKELWRCRHPNLYRLLRDGQNLMHVIGERTLPFPFRHWLRTKWKGTTYTPSIGWVRFGNLRRLTPLSREFGYDRGLPIDRYYIERFLAKNASDIRGHVMEIADNIYTRRFGGDQVTASDVLHVTEGNAQATMVGDLTCADHIPSGSFDCVILTQTLQFIYDVPAALRTVKRILKPGGVVLATLPGISPISRYDKERWGHFWAFTTQSARRLFEKVFPKEHVQTTTYGNVLAAASFLYGMATEELRKEELEYFDPDYELIIAIRAVKPGTHA